MIYILNSVVVKHTIYIIIAYMPFCFIIFLSYLLLGRQPEQGELSVDIPGHSSHEPDKYSTYF